MSENTAGSVTLAETTVAHINGVTVAASGIFQEDDGVNRVDLTVNRVKVPDLAVGDTFDINDSPYMIADLIPNDQPRKGKIVIGIKFTEDADQPAFSFQHPQQCLFARTKEK